MAWSLVNITRVETMCRPPPLTITSTSKIVSHGKHNLSVRNAFLSMKILYECLGFKKNVQIMSPIHAVINNKNINVIGNKIFCKTILRNINQPINPNKINAEATILLKMDGLIVTFDFKS